MNTGLARGTSFHPRRSMVRPVPTGHADDSAQAAVSSHAPDELSDEVRNREWYHTIELAPGVDTPGWFDLRPVAPKVLPRMLSGKRCLDVAAFDGFWTLEMQARGAGEVVAIDVLDPRQWDWPVGSDDDVRQAVSQRKGTGEGFSIVMEALGRKVERRALSVYDLDPADIGTFDFVYVGSLLLHLRDPCAPSSACEACAPVRSCSSTTSTQCSPHFIHVARSRLWTDTDGRGGGERTPPGSYAWFGAQALT